ncbi:MAG: hypothetical protein KDD62_06610 [Bdellovibrionales bacterium]|nr:hypothetical protein [Bdellovibrionales bacterium]
MLNDEYFILVHLNPTTEGVTIPEHLKGDPSVTLKLSQHFRGRMHLTQNKIIAELLFQGNYFDCHIPLDAIWGCSTETDKNHVWPESMPENVVSQLISDNLEIIETKKQASEITPSAPDEVEEAEDTEKNFKQRGHLRRVK